MNILNFIINNIYLIMLEHKEILFTTVQGVIKTLIDGIAFISNMENVMIGECYMTEEIKLHNNLKKQNENFKTIINSYIVKDYYIYQNLNNKLIRENEASYLIKKIFLNFEIILIGSQKFIYEYINYLKYLCNGYNNFKILVDKSIVVSNIREELYYNISLELISDIQNEHNVSLGGTLENARKLDKNILLQLFKNYFKIFKENPYKISIDLLNLYKDYSKTNILNYGLNYDINIFTNNKYILKYENNDILSVKNNFISSTKIIKNIDKTQYFITNNYIVGNSAFKKKNFYTVGDMFNNYVLRFEDRGTKSINLLNKTYTLRRLRILNNRFFNFQFLSGSFFVYPGSNYNGKGFIPYPNKIILSREFNGDNVFGYLKDIQGDYATGHQPDYPIRFIQSIARFFAGTEHHVELGNISHTIEGANTRDGKNMLEGKMINRKKALNLGARKLFEARQLYGGYTYGGAGHQDASFLLDEKNSFFVPNDKTYYMIGTHPVYYKSFIISDIKIDFTNFMENRPRFIMQKITKTNMGSSELQATLKELNRYEADNKKLAAAKKLLAANKNKPLVQKEIYIEQEGEVMIDTDLDKLMEKKKIKLGKKKMTSQKFKAVSRSYSNNEMTYKKALEMEKIRNEKDPLHILGKYPKAFRYNYLTTIPEITSMKVKVRKPVMNYLNIDVYTPRPVPKKGSKLVKLAKKLGMNNVDFGGNKKTKKMKLAIHGNIGLRFTRDFFKTYLIANDIGLDVNFLKKQDLLNKYKPYATFQKIGDSKIAEKIMKRPNLGKKFGKFVSLSNLAKYDEIYAKYMKTEVKPVIKEGLAVNLYDIIFTTNRSDGGKRLHMYQFIDKGDIYSKKGLQEAKNHLGSYEITRLPKRAQYLREIEKFDFKHEDIIKFTAKYNTPIKVKEVPLNGHKKVIRTPFKKAFTYHVPQKLFERYFYPEVTKRLKKVSFDKADLLFELNISKKKFISNQVKNIKYKYDLQVKFDMYKHVVARKFKNQLLRTKNMTNISQNGIRGFLMFFFNFDVFANTEFLSTMHFLRKRVITGDSFYTSIGSVTEPLDLNIIHKNFYGAHIKTNSFNNFLYKKFDLVNDTILPRSKNILLKKAYIKNLVYVYESEDRPMINFLFFILKSEEIKTLHKFIGNIISVLCEIFSDYIIKMINFYKIGVKFFVELIEQQLLQFREARRLKKFFERHPEYITYIIITILFFFYTIICIFLILIIKTFLPKNLVYGKFFKKNIQKDENNGDLLHNNITLEQKKIKDTENFIKTIYEIENNMEIEFDREEIVNDIKNELSKIEKIDEITLENLKKLELYVKLKKMQKLKIKKNFFDPEHKYVYSGVKDFNIREEIKNLKKLKNISLEERRFLKKRIYTTKFEENKVENLKKKYVIFYKTFIFEKNLEKGENNTKRRLDVFLKKNKKSIIKLVLMDVGQSFLDRRFNHNRILLGNDPDLEDISKITYMFAIYKPFFNFFFIIKFILGSIRLGDYTYGISKGKQYVMLGVHAKINYKDLRGRLEKDGSLEGYKDEADYGRIHFKDFVKIIKKFKKIKKTPSNKEISDNKKIRQEILDNILELTSEEDKLKEISRYMSYFRQIESDRATDNFEEKFKNIALKFILDVDKISPKKGAEQKLRYKYRNEVYKQKLNIENEEYEILKKSFTSRMKRDSTDKTKTLQTLYGRDDKKVKLIMKQKIAAIEYEKSIREYNYHNKFMDTGLDAKDKVFYEAIKEYNQELSEAYLELEQKETKEKLEENIYEKKSRKLLGILDQNYIGFRGFTTMGARFNYIFVLIISIFIGGFDNIKRIRKNEYSVTSLISIMKIDLYKFVYKSYGEYLIIGNKYKILKKFGYSIKEILKFTLILTPIILYSTFLYSIFALYFILFIIIYILPKKIYEKIKEKLIQKIFIKNFLKLIQKIFSCVVYIGKIFNLLFRNVETGATLGKQIYDIIYKFCGGVQYNSYMFRGAFILGYTKEDTNKVKNGLYSIKKGLKLKFNAYIEKKKKRKKKSLKIRVIKLREDTLLKIKLLSILLMPVKRYLLTTYLKTTYYLYAKIGKPIFKVERKEFVRIYEKNIELFKKYFKSILYTFKLLVKAFKNVRIKELIKLFIKIIGDFSKLPFIFVINHQRGKYVKNYKKGIQGFRNNPMYLVVDNPKEKKNGKLKLHNILMERDISFYLKDLLNSTSTLIDVFFIFKIHEVKGENKNYYQDYFGRKGYGYYKKVKEYVLDYLIDIAMKIEENYASFEESVETRNGTFGERIKYAFYTYRLYKHGMTRKSQQKKSRDMFFYKKIKDKNKIVRIYFVKGVINGITYITVHKVVFKKVKDLKSKKSRYKYVKYKYKLKDVDAKNFINSNIHITNELRNTPPQLGALIIMYDIYYKNLLRYRYGDGTFPKKGIEKEELETKKEYKGRLAAPEHNFDVPFYDRRFIAADVNNYKFTEFVETLANEPYDPLLRGIIFLVEYGMSTEDIILAGEQVGLNTKDENHFIWADVSLTHLLTFNKKLKEYKYEIKNFNRLMKGVDFFRVAENTFQRDKLSYYEDKYKEVAYTIMTENESILENILKERRTVRAKMLHKALLRSNFKTKYERDQELAKEQEREFYFTKKKEFFQELLIEEFGDGQAEYDDERPEDKYFNSDDLYKKTKDAAIFEEYFLKNRKKLEYNYLLNNIILKSYDQTMEEIHYFLAFKAGKILEKTLVKNKKKIIEINYKNINVSDKILSKINYNEHLVLKTKRSYDEKEKKEIIEEYFEYKYAKLEGAASKQEAIYGFMENNIIAEYCETGEYYPYELKIQYNEEAQRISRPPKPFHGQQFLKAGMQMVSKRHKTLKNIRKKKIKKEKIPLNIAYINNIKGTGEQGLIYTDVEVENELLNKNTVILNERFHLGNLKRVPIRMKLPVTLTTNIKDMNDYLANKSNYMSFMNHRHIMMLSDISPMLKQSLVGEECKIMLEKHFDKNIQDLIIGLFTAELFDRQVIKIKRDYQFVLKNFIQNYGVFHKLYFLGMPQYTGDLIRYHEAGGGQDEFPYHKYFQLKQIEFLNHDPAARKVVRHLYKLYIDKYSPLSFVFFFKNQFYVNSLYNIYGIMSIGCFIGVGKVLMYNPGEYLSENYMVFVPMLLTILFGFLRRSLKKERDISKGVEIYLYKYHTSKAINRTDAMYRKMRLEKKKKEGTEHFYDADKIQELFPDGIRSINTDLDPDGGRYHTHRNKDSEAYNYRHIKGGTFVLTAYFISEYGKSYKFKYRNKWGLGDYYRYDQELVNELRARGLIDSDTRAPQNYKEKQGFFDSGMRLESGGNWYSRGYENYYRKKGKLNDKPLDYGYEGQKISDIDAQIKIDKMIYHFPGAVADVNGIMFSRFVEAYNKLPEELKNFKKAVKIKRFEPRVKLSKRDKLKSKRQLAREKVERDRKVKFEDIFDDIKIRKLDRERELNNGEILKDAFFEIKNEYSDLFKRLYSRKRYIVEFHPLKKGAEFLFGIEDNVGYNTTGNIYARFLLTSKRKTKSFIQQDLIRYRLQEDKNVQQILDNYDVFKYINEYINMQEIRRNKAILVAKSKSFDKGEKMDMRTLLSIKDTELHVVCLRYYLLKNKQYRILRNILSNKKYAMKEKGAINLHKRYKDLIGEVKTYDTISQGSYFDIIKQGLNRITNISLKKKYINYYRFRLLKLKEIELYKALYRKTAKRLRRYHNYLENIPRRVNTLEKSEYRYNLMINLFKEKKDFGIFIKDFFSEITFSDLFAFIVKIIGKIFE